MEGIVLAGTLGLSGGALRVIVGILKAISKDKKIQWTNAFLTLIVSLILGFLLGAAFTFDYRLSALAGYAGLDILEGIYKSFKTEVIYAE